MKLKFSLCLNNKALRHECVWGRAPSFLIWHYLEVNAQFHAPAALPSSREPRYPIILIIILNDSDNKQTRYTHRICITCTRTHIAHSYAVHRFNYIACIFSLLYLYEYISLYVFTIDIQLDNAYEQGTQFLL
jgi:hypothetical protein